VPQIEVSAADGDHKSIVGSMKARMSKIFHLDAAHSSRKSGERARSDGHLSDSSSNSSASVGSSMPSRPPTPMLDPSTNTNPLQDHDDGRDQQHGYNERGEEKMNQGRKMAHAAKKRAAGDVSKHTFYVVNSQMRLKLIARNEVYFLLFRSYDILLILFSSFSGRCFSLSQRLRRRLLLRIIRATIVLGALHRLD